MQDGRNDIHNTPVQCENKSYFLSDVETSTNKKTTAYCTSIAQDAINEAANVYVYNTRSVVTDNEKKMQVVRNNLKETGSTCWDRMWHHHS